MKVVLNLNIAVIDTWEPVVLSNFPVAQFMIRPRSKTATLKLSYETADQDSKYVTVRPGEVWADSYVGHIPGKTIQISCNETGVVEIEMTTRQVTP